ncbi:Ankyrin repeat domain-containing protein [Entamoeba marina]
MNINHYPIHLNVLNNTFPPKELLNSDGINQFDSYGIPPLHYAIHMQNIDMVKYLIDNNANVLIRNKNGFNGYQEAVATRNTKLIQLIYDQTYKIYDKMYEERVDDGSRTLEEMHDFQFVLHWECQSWIPFGSYFLPSDNNLVRKKKNSLRFDMNIVGFSNYMIQKGKGSLIFYGEDNDQFKKGEVIFVDHGKKSVKRLCGYGARRDIKIDQVLKSNLTSMNAHLVFGATHAKTTFGHLKKEMINGEMCDVYDLTPSHVELITREVDKSTNAPQTFSNTIYDKENQTTHQRHNILLRKTDKEIFRKKTMNGEMWIGKNGIKLSQFLILMKFLSKHFDDFSRFEQFFQNHHLTDDDGFPVQFKIPLAFSLSTILRIQDYTTESPDESIFDIPTDYDIEN